MSSRKPVSSDSFAVSHESTHAKSLIFLVRTLCQNTRPALRKVAKLFWHTGHLKKLTTTSPSNSFVCPGMDRITIAIRKTVKKREEDTRRIGKWQYITTSHIEIHRHKKRKRWFTVKGYYEGKQYPIEHLQVHHHDEGLPNFG